MNSQQDIAIPSKYYKYIISLLGIGNARVVGGAVRDAILNKKNTGDIDIATSLPPHQVIDILLDHKITVIPTGLNYGTVTAIYNKEKFEITTLRCDIKSDGRHPEIKYTKDFTIDAARRDFTINAISYCPFEHKIYDYFNGLEHLRNAKLIFIGEPFRRLEEDFLRILRFFRFSCEYASVIDSAGLSACVALKENLRHLSRERIKWEMDRLIVLKNSGNILEKMFDCGILQIIYPVTTFKEDSFKNLTNANIATKYSILFHLTPDISLANLLKLKFSKAESFKICSIIGEINQPISEFRLRKIWFQYDDYMEYFKALLAIKRIDKRTLDEFLSRYLGRIKPVFPVNGHDLKIMGLASEKIGMNIKNLEDLWFKSDFSLSKQELLGTIDDH